MQDYLVYIMGGFIVLLLIVLYRCRTIEDIDKLTQINEDLRKRFLKYRIDAHKLSEYLSIHVDKRNNEILQSLQIVKVLVGKARDTSDYVNELMIDQLIHDLKDISRKTTDTHQIKQYKRVIQYLDNIKRQQSIIHDRLMQESVHIHRLLSQSDVFVRENIRDVLFKERDK